MRTVRFRPLICAAILLAVAGCDRVEHWQPFDTRTPHERYAGMLESAGLDRTALGQDWRTAAEQALAEAPVVSTPHVEEAFLDPAVPTAFAFRFTAQRGQDVAVAIDWRGAPPGLVFIDAWRVRDDSARSLDHLTSADSGRGELRFETRRGGEHVVRVQSELLRGGRFRISLRVGPSLAFPVLNGTNQDIGSLWGAPREGGRRSHRGIDIFARRRTPALAAAEGTVTRVGEDRLGGLVVWLRDRRGNALYYAHLDSQLVREGDQVQPGDTIGLVGRTGNARTTPAHLHFQVSHRGEGSVDPYWFVARTASLLPRLAVDTAVLGEWAHARRRAPLLAAPDQRAAARDTLMPRDSMQLLAGVGRFYRIRTTSGATGYLPAAVITVAPGRSVATE